MKTFVGGIMTFMGGFVASANLSRLVPTNPAYEAAWWKVMLALLIAVAGIIVLKQEKKNEVQG